MIPAFPSPSSICMRSPAVGIRSSFLVFPNLDLGSAVLQENAAVSLQNAWEVSVMPVEFLGFPFYSPFRLRARQ